MAEQLKLKNVRFVPDLDGQKSFDTVLSFRTFHENLPVLLIEGNMSHEESVTMQRPYAAYLRSFLKKGGYLVSVERYENKDHYKAMMEACGLEGLCLIEGSRTQIESVQGEQQDIFQCAVFEAE
ncbi:MAG: hypothetical protein IKD69_05340 [Solobacterium sp.]|nr:hypothetical protein [Solobacterium sp.]